MFQGNDIQPFEAVADTKYFFSESSVKLAPVITTSFE